VHAQRVWLGWSINRWRCRLACGLAGTSHPRIGTKSKKQEACVQYWY